MRLARFRWFLPAGLPLLLAAAFAQTPLAGEEPPRLDLSAAGMGRSTYKGYCATCHGRDGRGDGPLADQLRVAPTDLTQLAKENKGEFPCDKVVRLIDGRETVRSHGSPDMPVWGDAFQRAASGGDAAKTKARIEQLTHYIWSIQEQQG